MGFHLATARIIIHKWSKNEVEWGFSKRAVQPNLFQNPLMTHRGGLKRIQINQSTAEHTCMFTPEWLKNSNAGFGMGCSMNVFISDGNAVALPLNRLIMLKNLLVSLNNNPAMLEEFLYIDLNNRCLIFPKP